MTDLGDIVVRQPRSRKTDKPRAAAGFPAQLDIPVPNPLAGSGLPADEPLPERRGLWYRAHLKGTLLDEARAASTSNVPIFYDNPAKARAGLRGYSSFQFPHQLAAYINEMGWKEQRDWGGREVVAFHGVMTGRGEDDEPLVTPRADPRCCGRIVHERLPWEEFERRAATFPPQREPFPLWRQEPDEREQNAVGGAQSRHLRRHGGYIRTAPVNANKEAAAGDRPAPPAQLDLPTVSPRPAPGRASSPSRHAGAASIAPSRRGSSPLR